MNTSNNRSDHSSNWAQKKTNTKFLIFFIFIILILLVDTKIYIANKVSTEPYSGTELTFAEVPYHPDYERSCKFIQNNYQPGDCVLVKRERVADFYLNGYLKNRNNEEEKIIFGYHDLNISEIQSVFYSYRVWVLFDEPIEMLIPNSISQTEYEFIEHNTNKTFTSKDKYTTIRLEN